MGRAAETRGRVAGQDVEPGAQRGPTLETIEALPQVFAGLREHLVCRGLVPKDRHEKAEHLRAVTLHGFRRRVAQTSCVAQALDLALQVHLDESDASPGPTGPPSPSLARPRQSGRAPNSSGVARERAVPEDRLVLEDDLPIFRVSAKDR